MTEFTCLQCGVNNLVYEFVGLEVPVLFVCAACVEAPAAGRKPRKRRKGTIRVMKFPRLTKRVPDEPAYWHDLVRAYEEDR